jgi:hypothetical protein
MESGKSDNGQIIAILFFIIIIGGLYFFVWFPQIRGPATDLTSTVKIDPNGNISKYSIELQFVDSQSYTQFLQELNSPNRKTINEYVFRDILSPELFKIKNDSSNNKIVISSQSSFDPNNVFTHVKLIKYQDYWEFEDSSIVNSSYIPEKYVNKLTYTLTIPSKIIFANTIDNSSSFYFPNEKTLTWTIDKNKNPLNPFGENIGSPKIYVKFGVPEPTDYSRIIIIGVVIIICVILTIMFLRRNRY